MDSAYEQPPTHSQAQHGVTFTRCNQTDECDGAQGTHGLSGPLEALFFAAITTRDARVKLRDTCAFFPHFVHGLSAHTSAQHNTTTVTSPQGDAAIPLCKLTECHRFANLLQQHTG